MVWSVTPLPHWLYLRSNKHQLWPHEEVPEGLLVRVKLDFEQFQDFEIWKVRLFASIFLYSPWCDQLHRCHIGCILDRISTNYDHTKKFPRDSWCEWSWTLNNFKSDFGLRDLKSPTFCFRFFFRVGWQESALAGCTLVIIIFRPYLENDFSLLIQIARERYIEVWCMIQYNRLYCCQSSWRISWSHSEFILFFCVLNFNCQSLDAI